MWLSSLFQKTKGFLESPKTKAIELEISNLMIAAQPYIEDIASLVPNKTVQEIVKVYEKYGILIVQAELTDPIKRNNSLLNLATTILTKKFNPSSTSITQTAIQLALISLKLKNS